MPIAIHPQNRVPARVINYVTVLIRRGLLGGDDLHDIAFAVDWDGECPSGGEELFEALVRLTRFYHPVSAAFLISEACIALDWTVTA